MQAAGRVAYELSVGDFCCLAEPPTVREGRNRERERDNRREGPRRFHERTRPAVMVVHQKLGDNTYRLKNVTTGEVQQVTQHGRNVVKLDFPVLPLEPGQRKVLEIFDNQSGEWKRREIRRFAIDGRVNAQPMVREGDGYVEDGPASWVDLSEVHYRWVA